MKNQSEKMLLIMGEISRNSVSIPPEVKLILITKNRRNVEANLPKLYRHPPEFKPIFIMKNKTEQEIVEEMMGQISRLSPQAINHIGVWCLDLLRNRLELSLKELNKKD